MKERVFIKRNVFTCVMFGAIFLFILFESIYSKSNLSVIAFIIAIPIFILSLLKIIIDILEDLNDKITSFLSDFENRDIPDWEDLDLIRTCSNNNLENQIQIILKKYPDISWIKDDLRQYYNARKTQNSIRVLRRFILYTYYAIFMLVFVLLLLHTELYNFLSNNKFLTSINMDLFTVWSLIIILLEIMMKDIFEDMISYLFEKKIGINLEYY